MIKTIRFSEYRDVGDPVKTALVYDSQGADELIFLDISASTDGKSELHHILSDASESCFVPITAGGGMKTLADIERTLKSGADRVSINTEAAIRPGFINDAVREFGSSTLVVCIDVKKNIDGHDRVSILRGSKFLDRNPADWAVEASERGAGEIMLHFVDREGTMNDGYDLALLRKVADSVSVPICACGGVGKLNHFVEGVTVGHASSVAAASIFHFTDQSPIKVHAYMAGQGINVRSS